MCDQPDGPLHAWRLGMAGLVVLGEGVLVDARMHCQQRIDDFVRSGTGSYKVIFIRDRR